jgi:hypothetical protein
MPRMDTDATALGVAPAGEAPAGEVNR